MTTLPRSYREKVKPVTRPGATDISWIFPKGTVFDGDHAVFLVKTGQATPIDDECRQACGMTTEQLDTAQIGYVMDSLGINDPKHRDMYAGGVILGFDKDGEFIPGPNWDAYQQAIKELEKEDEI
jgi:hypothetical protein